jgi:imidazole glycerol-phosphate synthase subunit HisH
MIAIVDYGLGNIKAFANVYKQLDIPFLIATTAIELKKGTKIILPGVGAFDQAIELLQKSGMREALDDCVLQQKVPVLGICVGMQILARSSEEGKLPGLGWIDGVVKKIDTTGLSHKQLLPHMGWNTIQPKKNDGLFQGIAEDARFYFLHSFCFHCDDPRDASASTEYGGLLTCAVNSGTISGVQFHPEKSHHNGVQLLKNFGNI